MEAVHRLAEVHVYVFPVCMHCGKPWFFTQSDFTVLNRYMLPFPGKMPELLI